MANSDEVDPLLLEVVEACDGMVEAASYAVAAMARFLDSRQTPVLSPDDKIGLLVRIDTYARQQGIDPDIARDLLGEVIIRASEVEAERHKSSFGNLRAVQ